MTTLPQPGLHADGAPEVETLAFEDAYRLLDETVRALEDTDVTLDDAIKLYERGARLADRCQSLLEGAEQRIRQVGAGDPAGTSS